LANLIDTIWHNFKQASGEGAVYELRMRLLADKIPALQKTAYDDRLENVETLIIGHFGNDLSDVEKAALKLSRQLRNKILHCDFKAARDKLQELSIAPQNGGVRKIDAVGLSGNEMIQKILDATNNVPGTSINVADTKPEAGNIFSWLIESGLSGDFPQAITAFAATIKIIDRLASL
jgi:hypothetical protein